MTAPMGGCTVKEVTADLVEVLPKLGQSGLHLVRDGAGVVHGAPRDQQLCKRNLPDNHVCLVRGGEVAN